LPSCGGPPGATLEEADAIVRRPEPFGAVELLTAEDSA